MRKVARSEIVDYQTYADQRDEIRQRVLEHKAPRRIHVGQYLTLLFETTETVRYQVQEMMRAEQIVREGDIQHEIDTYNELLGEEGELGATLLIEIDDEKERDRLLRAWRDLPQHIYIKTDTGRVGASWDERQRDADRLSSVQYLKFKVGSARPLAIGVDHPQLSAESALSPEQAAALQADLSG